MSKISTSDFKNGLTIIYEGEPHLILKNEFISPGKGQSFNRVKLKGFKSGKVLEVSFKSNETAEACDVTYKTHTYLFTDGSKFTFMNPDTYEQFELSAESIGDAAKFLREGMDLPVQFLEGKPFAVVPPKKMQFKVISTPPGVKGDTKTGSNKTATLENGLTISVPMFINEGDSVIINTETGEYSERA